MDWIVYLLSAGLLPILLFLAIVFLVLGYSGGIGSWITIREGKRRAAVTVGFLCLVLSIVTVNGLVILIFGGNGVPLAAASASSTPVPTNTSSPTATDTPLPTIDPLSLVLGTPTDGALSTNIPVSTPTPTQPPLDASEPCAEEFNPPCTYTLQGETSSFSIARSATHNEDLAFLYAGLIRNLVRDENGYIAPIPQEVRIPSAETPIDAAYFEYYFSDFEWAICVEGETQLEVPCIYQVPQDFAVQSLEQDYQTIALQLFPNLSNAAKCIKDANTYLHKGGDGYAPIPIQPGATLIIPNPFASGRESCRS
jgi:hypothetical protein